MSLFIMYYLKLKKLLLFLLAIITYCGLLSGCATETVMKWTGQTEIVGKGGAFETKDGIDFYNSGEPAGTYKVLGIIQYSYYRGGNLGCILTLYLI